MKEHFYYFNFHIEEPNNGWIANDWSVVSSMEPFFPICDVRRWAKEEFGKDSEIIITYVMEVSDRDFKQLVSDVENDK